MVQFIMLYKVVLSFDLQISATKQDFPVVLFIMLYKVVLTFDSVDKIQDVTISVSSVPSCGVAYYAAQDEKKPEPS